MPLYWINKDLYYAYMALTKQSFGLLIATMTQWWSPTVVRISGDASVVGQIRRTADGRVECSFPERLVLIANHQVGVALFELRQTLMCAAIYGLGVPLVGCIHESA